MGKEDIKNILFVCTGNSCRSVMAEAYFRKRIHEGDLPFEVRSAGTMGIDGMLPPENTIKTLDNEGVDSRGYASTGFTDDLGHWADIILVMEPMHKKAIAEISPESVEKVFFLRQFSGDADMFMVPDPVGRSMGYYKTSFDIIKRSIEGFLSWLKK
ncbi:MAG: low molecular weight protein arginine phosphatase [Candidatus Omnitrophica bacterium]|nr:low molecular weight protein arginine phosphatase [Candidatus Omnitrophota bacterium]